MKDDLVRKIVIQIASLDKMDVNEVDENGELIPFGTVLGVVEVTEREPKGPTPPEIAS